MKLEGSLDAFSLPDIFQLLSYTKKTGGLRLQHADAQGVVYFADGTVTGATGEGGRQTLARRIVGLGLVDDAAVSAAVEAAQAGDGATGVVAALVAAGAVTPDAASRIAFEQLHDAVFELLRWPSGDFQFGVDETNPDDVGLRLSSDDVVARASEHKARWAAAAALVPSPDSVPNLVGTTDAETVMRAGDWPVLRLVDGRRRVSEIVELTGAGQLATVVALADLVERGLVEVRASDAPNPVEDAQRRMALLAPIESTPGESSPARSTPVERAPLPAPSDDADDVVASPAPEKSRPAPAEPERVAAVEPAEAAESAERMSTVVTVVERAAEADAPSVVEPATADEPTADEPEVVQAPPAAVVHDTVVEPLVERSGAASTPREAGPSATAPRLGGAHVPGDVVPPRAEPFLAQRRPEFAESGPSGLRATGTTDGAAVAAPAVDGLIERDPSVNRSLLLRLIAGVRGL